MPDVSKNITSKVFQPYLDFYWKFVAFCTVILIIWIVMNVSFDLSQKKAYWDKILEDPVFLLLSALILFSVFAGSLNLYRGKTITIANNKMLIFRSRWSERKIEASDIEYIRQGKEKLFQFSERLPVIIIKLKNSFGRIKIKPDRYKNEIELIKALKALKKKI